jgi:hypothetical protein
MNRPPADPVARDDGVADDVAVLSASVERIVISHTMLEVELAEGRVADDQTVLSLFLDAAVAPSTP